MSRQKFKAQVLFTYGDETTVIEQSITSNSMSEVVDSIDSELWENVNDLHEADTFKMTIRKL